MFCCFLIQIGFKIFGGVCLVVWIYLYVYIFLGRYFYLDVIYRIVKGFEGCVYDFSFVFLFLYDVREGVGSYYISYTVYVRLQVGFCFFFIRFMEVVALYKEVGLFGVIQYFMEDVQYVSVFLAIVIYYYDYFEVGEGNSLGRAQVFA